MRFGVACTMAGVAATLLAAPVDSSTEVYRGAVSGLVLTAGPSPQPIGRATVSLVGLDGPAEYVGISDERGQFVLEDIQLGRYALRAEKSGFLVGGFAQSASADLPVPVVVANGQISGLSIYLKRAASISGTVLDEQGQPLRGVTVTALRPVRSRDNVVERVLTAPAGSASTDENGEYRAFGLSEGPYIMAAQITGYVLRTTEPTASGSLRPRTFYPDAVTLPAARTVEIGPGEEVTGVNIIVRRIGGATVTVSIVDPAFPEGHSVQVWLQSKGTGIADDLPPAVPQPNGRFAFSPVPPGIYSLIARRVAPTGATGWARQTLTVGSNDRTDIALTLGRGVVVRGRLVSDNQVSAASNVKVRLFESSVDPLHYLPEATTEADGRFTFGAVAPARYRLDVALPSGIAVRSYQSSIGEVEDGAFEIPEAASVVEITATIAVASASVGGRLLSDKQQRVVGWYVVAVDGGNGGRSAKGASRYMARIATDNSFQLSGIIPGTYYLLVAEQISSENIAQLIAEADLERSSVKVHLVASRHLTQDLKIR